MKHKIGVFFEFIERPAQCTRESLVEHVLWLIRLRWIAVFGLIAVSIIASSVFPVLESPFPIYICAVILFLSNIFYYFNATKKSSEASSKDVVLGFVQVETDLIILTAVLHFSCFTFFM